MLRAETKPAPFVYKAKSAALGKAEKKRILRGPDKRAARTGTRSG